MTVPMHTTNLPEFLLDDEKYRNLEDDEKLSAGDWIEYAWGWAQTVDVKYIGQPANALPPIFNAHPAVNGFQTARAWRALTESEITSAVLNNKWRIEEQDAAGFV